MTIFNFLISHLNSLITIKINSFKTFLIRIKMCRFHTSELTAVLFLLA